MRNEDSAKAIWKYIKSCLIRISQNNGWYQRAASQKYGMLKSTIVLWYVEHNSAILFDRQGPNKPLQMNESQESKLLLKKIED